MINKTDMETRRIEHTNTRTEKPERVFAILHTPSAIRAWWGASRVIVLPHEKGVWAAVWGNENEFYRACEKGGHDTFAAISRYLNSQ